jgi:hypothetical protein
MQPVRDAKERLDGVQDDWVAEVYFVLGAPVKEFKMGK